MCLGIDEAGRGPVLGMSLCRAGNVSVHHGTTEYPVAFEFESFGFACTQDRWCMELPTGRWKKKRRWKTAVSTVGEQYPFIIK